MKHVSRFVLSVMVVTTVLSFALAFAPAPASRLIVSDAEAQVPIPTPSIPDIIPDDDPDPKPSPSPSLPGGGGGGGNGGGNHNGGGGNNNGGGGEEPNEDPKPDPGTDGTKPGENEPAPHEDGEGTGKGDKGDDTDKEDDAGLGGTSFDGTYHPGGSFSTAGLVRVATRLRALGLSSHEVMRRVYVPFILGGDAAWTDTWGAPRSGGRTHEGQDVFCNYGDPVLATEAGTVSYGDGGLGGLVARVHTDSTSYWYNAHLSDINSEAFPTGAHVEPGDVIGYCGNSGNAATTPPHDHFGHYVNGVAVNPHKDLVRWLHEAERRVLGEISKATDARVREIDRLTLARRFGDSFAPDLAELKVTGESLWASGSAPVSGAFALAEAALQAALAQDESASLDTAVETVAGDEEVGSAGPTRSLSDMLGSGPAPLSSEGHD